MLAEHGLMVAKDLAAKGEAARRALEPAFAARAPDPVAARKAESGRTKLRGWGQPPPPSALRCARPMVHSRRCAGEVGGLPYFRCLSNQSSVRCRLSIWFSRLAKP